MNYRVNLIHVRITADFFVETDKVILKFTLNYKGHRIAETILKENKLEGLCFVYA